MTVVYRCSPSAAGKSRESPSNTIFSIAGTFLCSESAMANAEPSNNAPTPFKPWPSVWFGNAGCFFDRLKDID